MANPEPDSTCHFRKPAAFESTHWSVVLAAAQSASSPAQQALEQLCQAYWYPLYGFLRRNGLDPDSAQDAVQEFFAERVITKRIFQGINPNHGKFRSWLLASLRNFLANQVDRRNAHKRGGGIDHVPFDCATAEDRFSFEPAELRTPEHFYERDWALALLSKTRERMRDQYEQNGRSGWFDELKAFLPGADSTKSRSETAARLGRDENAINVAIHRLRKEFGEILRLEIKRTVSRPEEVDEELRHLIQIVGG